MYRPLHDTVWIRIEYDAERDTARAEIRDQPGGRLLAKKEKTGKDAKRFYDKLKIYYFGYE